MNKTEVRNIIETTLRGGSKTPGLFDLPKVLGVKSRLESCASISEVVGVLEGNRSLISRAFGLSDSQINEGVAKLKTLDTAA